MVQYHFEYARRAKTPQEVRGHMRELHAVLGDVEVIIKVYAAFDGCASPIHTRLGKLDSLRDEDLNPILEDHPTQTGEIVPIY